MGGKLGGLSGLGRTPRRFVHRSGRAVKETMTARKRWLAVLRRQRPDRVPMDYWATPEATAKLLEHLGCADEDDRG